MHQPIQNDMFLRDYRYAVRLHVLADFSAPFLYKCLSPFRVLYLISSTSSTSHIPFYLTNYMDHALFC